MQSNELSTALPTIPVLDVGPRFGLATLERELPRAHALFDQATHRVPRRVLRSLDGVSRRWLERWDHGHLDEIDAIAKLIDRPGAYFLSVNYEWGCTCRVGPSPDAKSARLVRVLDWATPGLGRHLVCARVKAAAGPFTALMWPGYSGVIQAMAPGRFSGALNQAPYRSTTGIFPLDWAVNRGRVWRTPHPTPASVMRDVFETAGSFKEAKEMLTRRPVAAPAIFSLAGLKPNECAVIERREESACVHEGTNTAANHWQTPGWRATPRGSDSPGRAAMMHRVVPDFDPTFPWLAAPILNPRTRLVMMADAATGQVVAQGYEATGAATQPLVLKGSFA
jgi:hypothetical protein